MQLLTNPRTFVLCLWNFRSRGRKFYGTFAPGNERSIELSPPGAKVPRMKLSLQGVKVPRSESSCYLWPCAALYLLQRPDGLACGDQRRLTGNGSALEVVPRRCAIQIHDFTLLYFTSNCDIGYVQFAFSQTEKPATQLKLT